MLRHDLVNHDALGPQDGGEVSQREHTDSMTQLASAAFIPVVPQLEVISGQWRALLLDSPASGDLCDLGYPGQGGDDHLIGDIGQLGPL